MIEVRCQGLYLTPSAADRALGFYIPDRREFERRHRALIQFKCRR
jgi:hypothetical protein